MGVQGSTHYIFTGQDWFDLVEKQTGIRIYSSSEISEESVMVIAGDGIQFLDLFSLYFFEINDTPFEMYKQGESPLLVLGNNN